MIKIEGLSKFFGSLEILKGISFHIRPGEIVSILGSSGSGKTTLLRCINKLESFERGNIFIQDVNINDFSPQKVAIELEVGMIFQNFNLFPHKTVLENLLYAPQKQKRDVEEKVSTLLKRFNLLDLQNAYPSTLSGGQKQRVAILRALALEPKILVLDEPTSALDPENVYEVVELVKELARMGMTMIIVSHELSFIKKVSSRILFLDQGRVVEDDNSSDFFVSPKTERAKEFLKHFLVLGEK